jgi:ribosomal protein S18 acetylase RimI-like enzyme
LEIKTAGREDIGGICQVYRALYEAMADLQPEYCAPGQPDRDFLLRRMESGDSEIFVAREGQAVIGFALVQRQRVPPLDCLVKHDYAYLTDLAVMPKYRSRGAGTLLLDAAEAWARANKLDYLELNVLSNNGGARRLYGRNGYEESSCTMRKKLR